MPTACINQPDCRVSLKSGRLEISGRNEQTQRDEVLREIPLRDLDRLIAAESVQITSAADARSNGIETVYQDLALFDNLNPTANFFAGREVAHPSWLPRGLQWMKKKEMSTRTKELLDRLQIRLPHFDADVALMSGGQRQAVAVARAVAFSSKLVILDEPTAALGLRESARVLELVDRLRTSGVAVILISHSMDHVMAVADRAMVMRRGRKIGDAPATADNQEQLVSWIVGARGSTTV